MFKFNLPVPIHEYLKKLVTIHPSISEIYLFGSRANDEAHKESDWDFMVFGNSDVLSNLKKEGPSTI